MGYVIIPDMAGAKTFALTQPRTFDVRCRSSRQTREYASHEITVSPDWSITTPHDLEAERIAAAFGSRISCVELDTALAAARDGIALRMRRRWYPLRRIGLSHWEIDGVFDNRGRMQFASAVTAASYVRSADYLAEKHGATAWQVHRLIEVFACWGNAHIAPPNGSNNRRLITEQNGLNRLWDAGIHPDSLPQIRSWIGQTDGPLPASTYIEIAYSRISPGEFRRMLAIADLNTVIAGIGNGVRNASDLNNQLKDSPGDQP